jgi:sulfate adenylyltransferase subunit 1
VFAVNKLDAVEDPGPAFEAVKAALEHFADEATIDHAGIVPVSALRGDNVTSPLVSNWYHGPSLLQLLESLPSAQEDTQAAFELPVQYVARQGEGTGEQPRVFWGRIAQGAVQVGDAVQVFPSGERATVAALRRAATAADRVEAGQSAGVVLDRQLDISRGDWIAAAGQLKPVQRFVATLAWLDTEAATPGRKYWVRHGNRWVQARLSAVKNRLDIHTLIPQQAEHLSVNDIGEVVVELQQPLPLARYADNRVGGALIVVDPASNRTSGALLVVDTEAE